MIELMINDAVPYSFGHKINYGKIVGIKIVTDIVAGERTGVFTERSYTIKDGDNIRGDYKQENFEQAAAKRLEKLRIELEAERISYGELNELTGLIPFIDAGDVQLLEAAGVLESATI